MTKANDKRLLYYQKEMSFLRDMGQIFAHQHPKVAKRLGLSASHASDPQVERLIEAFAFLTSYLQEDIDNQMPRLSTALLDALYPDLTQPVPSMGILKSDISSKQKFSHPIVLKKGSAVFTQTTQGKTVRFKTMQECVFRPLEIHDVDVVSVRDYPYLTPYYEKHTVLRVQYRCLSSAPHEALSGKIRFYIDMPRSQALPLYSYIMRAKDSLSFSKNKEKFARALNTSVHTVGVESLPHEGTHQGYSRLQQYFALPESFLFFDVEIPLEFRAEEGEILIPLATEEPLSSFNISKDHLRLHCVPVINLFEKTSEPITVDHQKVEYRVVADRKNEEGLEVHSVEEVYSSRSLEEKERIVAPYFSYNYEHFLNDTNIYWYARRVPSSKHMGSDMYLSFVDKEAQPLQSADETVYVRTLCTNRYAASDILGGTMFFLDEAIPVESMTSLFEITEPMYALNREDQWKLVSMLATSYLSFSDEKQGVQRLQNVLSILSTRNTQDFRNEIMSLSSLRVESCVRRVVSHKEWAGLTHGQRVLLSVDEHYVSADSLYLLLSLINVFLSTQVHVHTFSELSVLSNVREGVWHKWRQMSGSAPTI